MKKIEHPCPLCGDELGEHDREMCCRCRGDRAPDDTKLRKEGYQIVHRPRNKEAQWQRVWVDGKGRVHKGAIIGFKEALKNVQGEF